MEPSDKATNSFVSFHMPVQIASFLIKINLINVISLKPIIQKIPLIFRYILTFFNTEIIDI